MRTNQRVTGIVRRGKSILLIQRLREGHEYWVFPGGGVEEGETLEQALRREMLEETSLELRSFRFLYASKQHMDVFFYECVLAEGEPQLGGPELAAQSPSNQYILRWVEFSRAAALPGLYPSPDWEALRAVFPAA